MNRRLMLGLLGSLSLAGGGAFAQTTPAAPGPARIRGTVNAVTPDGLDLTTRDGAKQHIVLPATFRVVSVIKSKIADIQPGSYIGSAAAPQPDGTLKALEVTVFPPAMKGAGQGSYAWDLGPSSSMTNGTVGKLETTSGRMMTVDYGSGEKKIVIPDDVPIVSLELADRNIIVPGAHVIVNGTRAADGTITAAGVNVGKDGITPPM
ncbi:hypothetical protein [Acidisphaera sp. L21]|jgi:hypothetical protein|uniref:hypothetical protein n=1 Tax=Acidisphaera sp. L21 TaxID=1641851 RepID=UPI00131E54F5|nr:hypothetical protein [Acidisphaera sp. L21]